MPLGRRSPALNNHNNNNKTTATATTTTDHRQHARRGPIKCHPSYDTQQQRRREQHRS